MVWVKISMKYIELKKKSLLTTAFTRETTVVSWGTVLYLKHPHIDLLPIRGYTYSKKIQYCTRGISWTTQIFKVSEKMDKKGLGVYGPNLCCVELGPSCWGLTRSET